MRIGGGMTKGEGRQWGRLGEDGEAPSSWGLPWVLI